MASSVWRDRYSPPPPLSVSRSGLFHSACCIGAVSGCDVTSDTTGGTGCCRKGLPRTTGPQLWSERLNRLSGLGPLLSCAGYVFGMLWPVCVRAPVWEPKPPGTISTVVRVFLNLPLFCYQPKGCACEACSACPSFICFSTPICHLSL